MHAFFKVALPVLVIATVITVAVTVALTLPRASRECDGGNPHSHRPTYSGAVPWSHVYFPLADFDGTTWTDQSGNNNDVTATGSPATVAGVLTLTSAQTLTWPAGSIPTDYTILARMKLATGTAAHLLEGLTGSAAWTLSHDGAGTVTHTYDGTDTALATDGAEWQVVAFKNEPPVSSGFSTAPTLNASALDNSTYNESNSGNLGERLHVNEDGTVVFWSFGNFITGAGNAGVIIYYYRNSTWNSVVFDKTTDGVGCGFKADLTADGTRIFIRAASLIYEIYWNGSTYAVRTHNDGLALAYRVVCGGDSTDVMVVTHNYVSASEATLYAYNIDSSGTMTSLPFNAGTNSWTSTQNIWQFNGPVASKTGIRKIGFMEYGGTGTAWHVWHDNGTDSWDYYTETFPVQPVDHYTASGDLTIFVNPSGGGNLTMYRFDHTANPGSRFTTIRTVNVSISSGALSIPIGMSYDGNTLNYEHNQNNSVSLKAFLASAGTSWSVLTTNYANWSQSLYSTCAGISGDGSRVFYAALTKTSVPLVAKIRYADAPTSAATSLYTKNTTLQSLTQTIPAASGNNSFQLTVNAGTSNVPAAVELKEVRIYDSHLSGATISTLVDEMLAMLDPPHSITYGNVVGFVGTAISNVTPSASGGTASSITSSALAALGLSVDGSTGVVSGTPSVTAASALTVAWANEAGTTNASVQTQIYAVPAFTVASVAVMTTDGVLSNLTPTLAPATDDYVSWSNFAVASGTLPDGITLDPDTGVLSGTLTDVDNFAPVDLTLSADLTVYGTVTTNTITLRLPDPEVVDTPSTSTDATVVDVVNLQYEETVNQVVVGEVLTIQPTLDFTGSGTTFSIFQDTLPAELTINAETGVISGTAAKVLPPRYHVVVAVQGTKRVEVTLIIRVDYGINYTVTYGNVQQRADGVWLFPLNETLTLGPDLGALSAVSFELAGGTLPTGVTFDTETGQLAGTPTQDTETGTVEIDIATSPTNDSAFARSELTYLVTRDVPTAAAAAEANTETNVAGVACVAAGGCAALAGIVGGVIAHKRERKGWRMFCIGLGLVGVVLILVGVLDLEVTKTVSLVNKRKVTVSPSRAARAKLSSVRRTVVPRVSSDKYVVRSGQPVTLKVAESGLCGMVAPGLPYGLTIDDTGTISGVCRARCTKSSTYAVSTTRDHVQTLVYFDLEVTE